MDRIRRVGKVFIVTVLAGTGLYHLLFIAGVLAKLGIYMDVAKHVSISLGLLLFLVFLIYPAKAGRPGIKWYDLLFSLGGLISCFYRVAFEDTVTQHYLTLSPTVIETILGIILYITLMEGVRRTIGLAMPILASIFLVYVFISGRLPVGLFFARSLNLSQVVNGFYLSSESGIFGTVSQVSAFTIFPFVAFGAIFMASGAGKFFVDLSVSLAGSKRGGPAKVAVVASSLFGTISGSTAASVATVGSFTIPMMKRIGFKPSFAGAVEAVAGNGGTIMPPVMGIVAFIMAEVIRVPYFAICLAALIPAILYYVALYIAIDLEAVKEGLKGMPRAEIPPFGRVVANGWHYLIPIAALLVFLLGIKTPPEVSAIYSIVVLIIISMFKRESRLGPGRLVNGLKSGTVTMLLIGPVCGISGVVLSAINVSGVAVTLSSTLMGFAGENIVSILLVCAALAYIMGMGAGILTIYIILAAVVAPIMVGKGISPMAAHLFVFYWGLTSFITPPYAVAAFVAAGIAGSKAAETGWQACRLGIATYIIPFYFVFNQGLLFRGSIVEIVSATIVAIIGISILAVGGSGYFYRPLNWPQRIALMISSFLLVFAQWLTYLAGFALALIILFPQLKLLVTSRLNKSGISYGQQS